MPNVELRSVNGQVPTDNVMAISDGRMDRAASYNGYDNAAFDTASVRSSGSTEHKTRVESIDLDGISVDQIGSGYSQKDQNNSSCSVEHIQTSISIFFTRHRDTLKTIAIFLVVCGYFAYFGYCLSLGIHGEDDVRLIWITSLVVVILFWSSVRDYFNDPVGRYIGKPLVSFVTKRWRLFKWGFIILALGGYLAIIVDVALKHPENLVSFAGFVTFIILVYVFSTNPSKVRWQPVLWGLGIQFTLALIIIKTSWGFEASKWLGDRAQELLSHSDAGAEFVFGEKYTDHMFAFQVLPIVIFFSSLVSILYHVGLMQAVIGQIAWAMQVTLGTTAAESTNAAGNIFIGQTEAPLLIRPFIHDMTRSELHAVMTGGFATIAGSVMAAYILFGVPANHLITASFLAAPCALGMSKLSCPETEDTRTSSNQIKNLESTKATNIVEAAGSGASAAVKLVGGIAANLIAFLALLHLVNGTLAWFGARAGLTAPDHQELSFELICSYIFWPFAFLMGVHTSDCGKVAELIGVKMFLNEFVAYEGLGKYIENTKIFNAYNGSYIDTRDGIFLQDTNTTLVGGILSDRSTVISTYALCGFANVGSIGMTLGALSAMAPSQKSIIAGLAVRTMITGTVVSFLNACTAGLLYEPTG